MPGKEVRHDTEASMVMPMVLPFIWLSAGIEK